MQPLLKLTELIDALLGFLAKIGAWCAFALAIVVCYDVLSRYFGVPKPFGLNSTMVQESEFWLHTFLFSLVMGYCYIKQGHVRIDLIRDRLPMKIKYAIEAFGCLFFLLTYAAIGIYYTTAYTYQSFLEGEVSKSVIGLSHIWVLKSAMPIMFTLIALAGISQFIKSLAGLFGQLPEHKVTETLGGDN